MTDAIVISAAVLAVITQVLLAFLLLVFVASRFSSGAKRLLDEIRDTLLGLELWFAWTFAAAATAGSLYFSEFANFEPCILCWYQRIAMYPLAVVLLGMAIRKDIRNGFWYALPLPLIGIAVGLYHEYITYNPEAETQACREGVSCAVRWIDEFGYITMPTLALSAFGAIVALLLLARSRDRADRHTLDTGNAAD